MTQYTLQDMIQVIETNKLRVCYIYDMDRNKIAQFSEEDSASLIFKIQNFCKAKPNIYKFRMKAFYTSKDSKDFMFNYVNCTDEPTQDADVLDTQIPFHSVADMKNKILAQAKAEIYAELEAKRKQEEIEELKQELQQKIAELNTVQGKFNYLASNALQGFLGGFMNNNTNRVMQGNPNVRTELHDENNDQDVPFTQQQIEQLNQSFAKLLQVMDADTFIQFSDYIVKNPNVIQTLKTFIH